MNDPCRWCRTEEATQVVLGWPTCDICASSRQVRVSRWLRNPWHAPKVKTKA